MTIKPNGFNMLKKPYYSHGLGADLKRKINLFFVFDKL